MKKVTYSTFLIFLVFVLNLQGQTTPDSSKSYPFALQKDSNLVIFHSFFETNDVSPIRLERALVFGYKALDHARNAGAANLVDSIQQGLEFCYFFLSANAAKRFDYLTAYKYSERRLNLKDSMFETQRRAQVSELKSTFESDKKKLQEQLDVLQKKIATLEHTLAAQEERESRNLMICLSVAALFLVAFFFLLPGYLLGKALSRAHALKPDSAELVKQAESSATKTESGDVNAGHSEAKAEKKQAELIPVKVENAVGPIVPKEKTESTESLLAARKIQQSLFASDALLKKNLPEVFVLDKASETVSGDFYWARETGTGLFYLCVADCKGHGVSGAFRSMLFMGLLDEALVEKKITSPDLVFADVHEKIIQFLNPGRSATYPKEGMDGVLCMFDLKGGWLRFCCANNPLWLIRNGELKEFAADNRTIGRLTEEEKPLKLQTLGLRKGDCIYLFSNGLAKQTNASGEKFGYTRLQELLLANSALPMEQQQLKLADALAAWNPGATQVDDILVMGVRV